MLPESPIAPEKVPLKSLVRVLLAKRFEGIDPERDEASAKV